MNTRNIAYIFYRWSIFPTFLFVLCVLLSYMADCSRRGGDQHWHVSASEDDKSFYHVEYSYAGRGWVFLRLYSRKEARVVAERLFRSSDPVRVYWTSESVIYSDPEADSFHDGVIRLPPTWLDRVLAYLP